MPFSPIPAQLGIQYREGFSYLNDQAKHKLKPLESRRKEFPISQEK